VIGSGKAGDRGFTVGACHRDHVFRLTAKPKGGGIGQCCAGLFGHDQSGTGGFDLWPCQFGTSGISQNRGGPFFKGSSYKGGAVDLHARKGRKKMPLRDSAAVHTDACDGRILSGPGSQTQFC
jgi:hypothetical protein